MKPRGRSPKAFTKIELEMIQEYLESDKGLKEVSTKYGLSSEGLRYKVKKYLKIKEKEKDGST